MWSKLSVKLAADNNYIPVRYNIVAMKAGSARSTTYCVLEVTRVGWDTQVHYNNWIPQKVYIPAPINPLTPIQSLGTYVGLSGRSTAGIQGTLGVLTVAKLSDLVEYSFAIKNYIMSGGIVLSGNANYQFQTSTILLIDYFPSGRAVFSGAAITVRVNPQYIYVSSGNAVFSGFAPASG